MNMSQPETTAAAAAPASKAVRAHWAANSRSQQCLPADMAAGWEKQPLATPECELHHKSVAFLTQVLPKS
jgi:hypothetical protein